jgi:hypothetical protein
MEECEETGNRPVVPRAMAHDAPGNAIFPSVPRMEHDWFCERDTRHYECSCGLWQLRQNRGDFIRYDASMCSVKHPKSHLPAAKDNLALFLNLLKAKTAKVNMNQEDE